MNRNPRITPRGPRPLNGRISSSSTESWQYYTQSHRPNIDFRLVDPSTLGTISDEEGEGENDFVLGMEIGRRDTRSPSLAPSQAHNDSTASTDTFYTAPSATDTVGSRYDMPGARIPSTRATPSPSHLPTLIRPRFAPAMYDGVSSRIDSSENASNPIGTQTALLRLCEEMRKTYNVTLAEPGPLPSEDPVIDNMCAIYAIFGRAYMKARKLDEDKQKVFAAAKICEELGKRLKARATSHRGQAESKGLQESGD